MVTEILKPYLEEHGAVLSEKQLSQLESYARLLTEWNEKMNLTAIVDEEGIALKHFLDSLALLRHAVCHSAAAPLQAVGDAFRFTDLHAAHMLQLTQDRVMLLCQRQQMQAFHFDDGHATVSPPFPRYRPRHCPSLP